MLAKTLLLLLPLVSAAALPSPDKRNHGQFKLNAYEQELFDYSMLINDLSWDNSTGWVWSDADYGHWDTRFTCWYAVGLLARGQGEDVANAQRAIRNVISVQFVNDTFSEPWHGTYKTAPDVPDPGPLWEPSIYYSYDPNWSFFIGVTLVQIVEEYGWLLPQDLLDEIYQSCYRASRGLMTRNGYNGDNLVTAYTNPGLGRALLVSWTGAKLNDANLTAAGEQYAQNIYDLFTAQGYNTFGEYNVPTYYGEDVGLLCQWIKHSPKNSSLATKGTYMLGKLWDDISELYNYNLKNIAGPYDRVYHRNSLVDNNIITFWFWMLLGRKQAPVASRGQSTTLYDGTQGASLALLGPTLSTVLNETLISSLTQPVGSDRVLTRHIRSSLDNTTTRTNTMWINSNVMAGGQMINESVARSNQYTPMIAHWKSGETANPERPFVSFFQLVGTATTINATVTPGHISISYPNITEKGANMMEFYIGDIPIPYYSAGKVMDGFRNLPCLDVNVKVTGMNETIGQYDQASIQSNSFYVVTYQVEANFTGTPSIEMDLTYTC